MVAPSHRMISQNLSPDDTTASDTQWQTMKHNSVSATAPRLLAVLRFHFAERPALSRDAAPTSAAAAVYARLVARRSNLSVASRVEPACVRDYERQHGRAAGDDRCRWISRSVVPSRETRADAAAHPWSAPVRSFRYGLRAEFRRAAKAPGPHLERIGPPLRERERRRNSRLRGAQHSARPGG